ncbi:hypothetical protein CNMCM5793_000901 [Aspergillus hiratsukae]|uniref:NodB homology domain-containing protein n=1 Tax=Aspergillus hiratsukae TaxID=1194566 RepID=A0A8H6PAB1_9EURO|nr:hypothetical protein CNMCM5793_000901 [Aspergillus hiratsukae]
MPSKKVLCAFGVHVDAIAGWLGTYGGEDSISDISCGLFAGEVGIQRLLDLFKKHNLKSTWFIPGHSIETFPVQCKKVVKAGHEIALHGYLHEDPRKCSVEQQRAIMHKSYDLIKDLSGKAPRGTCAPFNQLSETQVDILEELGIEYDNSMSAHDCLPYWLVDGHSWTKVQYDKPAEEWMKPFVHGTRKRNIVEIPCSWYMEDMMPMQYLQNVGNANGWVDPRTVEYMWKERFEYFYENYDEFVFPMTLHPDTAGLPHVLRMVERFLLWTMSKSGVEWVEYGDINDWHRAKNPSKQ